MKTLKKITQTRIHIWNRCFLKQDLSLTIDRKEAPYRRLSITILIAAGKPFTYRNTHNQDNAYQGVILGPNVDRTFIQAIDSDISIFDAFITTPEYKDLMNCVNPYEMRSLTQEELNKTHNLCHSSFYQALSLDGAAQLFDAVIYSICEQNNQHTNRDLRILRVVDIIEQHRAEDLSVTMLAGNVNLSESRLRSLFKQHMHCTLPQYIRSVSVWKTIPLLAQGMNFTDAAHEAGFHDLAHFSRAVSEVIGTPPSSILKKRDLTVSLQPS
ncbi:MAG: hypothetical protein COA99_04390 [Moraxellaceae bacterium]|nr:MAG: hypothetical protein COA99_04390 [Moraxellaceae bacterium]